jgi:hypothetical protein
MTPSTSPCSPAADDGGGGCIIGAPASGSRLLTVSKPYPASLSAVWVRVFTFVNLIVVIMPVLAGP